RPAALRTVVPTTQPITRLTMSADGRLVAAVDAAGVVHLRAAGSGQRAGASGPSPGVELDSVGLVGRSVVVTGSGDTHGARGLLSFTRLGETRSAPRTYQGVVADVVTSARGRVALIDVGSAVALWDGVHGKRLRDLPLGKGSFATALAFTPD